MNPSSRNVVEDVIPELDENLTTMTGMREQEKKPTVQDIFGPASRSEPIDVPVSGSASSRTILEEENKPLLEGPAVRPKFTLFPVDQGSLEKAGESPESLAAKARKGLGLGPAETKGDDSKAEVYLLSDTDACPGGSDKGPDGGDVG